MSGHGGHRTTSPLGQNVAQNDSTLIVDLQNPLGDALFSVTGKWSK